MRFIHMVSLFQTLIWYMWMRSVNVLIQRISHGTLMNMTVNTIYPISKRLSKKDLSLGLKIAGKAYLLNRR